MTLPASYFDRLYDETDDPWGFRSRWYEQRKYAMTMAVLPRPRFRRGFEPGCSIGVLTEALAERCDELLAVDVASAAVDAACRRVAGREHVTVQQLAVPEQWPEGRFDLVVLSEMGYYLSPGALVTLAHRSASSLTDDGAVVAVHWRHVVEDYPMSGDEVHAVLEAELGLERAVCHREVDVALDVFTAAGLRSVAAEEGLVP